MKLYETVIADFGGYEAAKKVSESESAGFLHNVAALKQRLLEYRREHNIFEVGDKVVSTLDGDEDWKNAVCEILAFHKKMAITTGFSCAIHHYDYRHATDKEIEAGRRL